MSVGNLFEDIPANLPDELAQTLLNRKIIRIERIISKGHSSPDGFWYDQEEDEWVLLLAGSAGLQFEHETEPRVLKPGDHLYIPAHCRHRVAWTDRVANSIWLAVFFPETETRA